MFMTFGDRSGWREGRCRNGGHAISVRRAVTKRDVGIAARRCFGLTRRSSF
jgi:hypothetical protein